MMLKTWCKILPFFVIEYLSKKGEIYNINGIDYYMPFYNVFFEKRKK